MEIKHKFGALKELKTKIKKIDVKKIQHGLKEKVANIDHQAIKQKIQTTASKFEQSQAVQNMKNNLGSLIKKDQADTSKQQTKEGE